VRYAVVIEKATKNYSAYLPDVPGCIAAGKTVEETLSLLREALIMHFHAMSNDGETIPNPDSLVTYFDVETPAERATPISQTQDHVKSGREKAARLAPGGSRLRRHRGRPGSLSISP